MEYKYLNIDQDGPVAVVRLNRPEKRNALNIPLLQAFCAALDEIHDDPSQRVIVLTGAGPSFCAGLDLTEALDPEKSHESGNWFDKV